MIDSNAKISFLKWGLRPIEECVNWWYIAVAHNSTIYLKLVDIARMGIIKAKYNRRKMFALKNDFANLIGGHSFLRLIGFGVMAHQYSAVMVIQS